MARHAAATACCCMVMLALCGIQSVHGRSGPLPDPEAPVPELPRAARREAGPAATAQPRRRQAEAARGASAASPQFLGLGSLASGAPIPELDALFREAFGPSGATINFGADASRAQAQRAEGVRVQVQVGGSFDAARCGQGWKQASACSPGAQKVALDWQGCPWGYQQGASCAAKDYGAWQQQQQPQQQPQQQQQQPDGGSGAGCTQGWHDAPVCSSNVKRIVKDREGCLWAYEAGRSCAVKPRQQQQQPQPQQPQQQPDVARGGGSACTQGWHDAPTCSSAVKRIVKDREGCLWAYEHRRSCAVRDAQQQPQQQPAADSKARRGDPALCGRGWQEAPACARGAQQVSRDLQGCAWGFEGGRSCAIRDQQGPELLPAWPKPAPGGGGGDPTAACSKSWWEAPACGAGARRVATNSQGCPWGYEDGRSCAMRPAQPERQAPQRPSEPSEPAAAPAPAPVPAPVPVPAPEPVPQPQPPQAAVPAASPEPLSPPSPSPAVPSPQPEQAQPAPAAPVTPSPSPAAAPPSPSPSPQPQQQQQQQPEQQPRQPEQQPRQPEQQPWLDARLPMQARINSLLAALTLEEKAGMMIHGQAGVPRLGLKPFQFWTECLHGHQEMHDGALPTLFPQPLMLAATWNPDLAHEVFSAISDELRAKSNTELEKTGIHKYLTCWTPHINLFKDPRWGRGSETFGEDPLLTAAFAKAIVTGLQGDDPSITKVVATCKHFLGYGVEGAEGVSRYNQNFDITPQDLVDTELPPFEACIQAAHGQGIMCSYNAVNGEPACASSVLLKDLLRDTLGFQGYVVSDCNAVAALKWGHATAGSYAEAAGQAVRAGVDLLCDRPEVVKEAVAAGALTAADLDGALNKTLAMRFMTGQFEPPAANPWGRLAADAVVNSAGHRELARRVVQQGTVLLKNDPTRTTYRPVLPLAPSSLRKVCVVGPLADAGEHLMGNYYGKYDAAAAVSPRRAITEELAKSGVNVSYARGMDLVGEIHYDWPLESAVEACSGADVGIVVVGSSMIEPDKKPDGTFKPATEGEGMDRTTLKLPGHQADLIKALDNRLPNVPLVVVLMHGGGLDVAWMHQVPSVKGIVSLPFPGQEGGRGLADVLLGRVSPSGRLPITWYANEYTTKVSPLHLGMRPVPERGYPGRSYRFLKEKGYVVYPFGTGLSYTTFAYSGMRPLRAGEPGCEAAAALPAPAMCVNLTVTNTGSGAPGGTGWAGAAEHVVPLYMTHTASAGVRGHPRQALRAFKRTRPLAPGESQTLIFVLTRDDFSLSREDIGWLSLFPGFWQVSAGVWDAPGAAEQPAVAAASRTSAQQAAHHAEYPEASEAEDVGLTSQMTVGGSEGSNTVTSLSLSGSGSGARATASTSAAGQGGNSTASASGLAASASNSTAAGVSAVGGGGGAEPSRPAPPAPSSAAAAAAAPSAVSADSRTGLSITVEVASQVPQPFYVA